VLNSSSTPAVDDPASFDGFAPQNNSTCPQAKQHKQHINLDACRDYVALEGSFDICIVEASLSLYD